LSGLEERFGHLEAASKDMASQVCLGYRSPVRWLTVIRFLLGKETGYAAEREELVWFVNKYIEMNHYG
jgi:hypothetical protein